MERMRMCIDQHLIFHCSLIVEIARGARRNDERRNNGNDR